MNTPTHTEPNPRHARARAALLAFARSRGWSFDPAFDPCRPVSTEAVTRLVLLDVRSREAAEVTLGEQDHEDPAKAWFAEWADVATDQQLDVLVGEGPTPEAALQALAAALAGGASADLFPGARSTSERAPESGPCRRTVLVYRPRMWYATPTDRGQCPRRPTRA